jgi:glycerate kinase
MRVVIAPDSFTGTLTARAAAEAIAAGWRRRAPSDDLELVPLSDGGPGFIDVLRTALPGRLLAVTVPGPLGGPAPAELLAVEQDGGLTVYAESAQACGLHLVPQDRRDPTTTSTAGVATLLLEARSAGATRIVLGLGGSGTTDGGAGLLAALAASAGLGSSAGHEGAPASLVDLRAQWSGVDLVIASDVDAPLLGPQGAALGFSPQKGASPEQARALEAVLSRFARDALAETGLPQKLLVEAGCSCSAPAG